MKYTRRQFFGSLTSLGIGGSGLFSYMRYFEPHRLQHSHLSLKLGMAQPLRILHLSDIHASDVVPMSFIEKAFDAGLAQQPDMICITGDFITGHIQERETYQRLLKRLADSAPTLACLGNHDGGRWAAPQGGYTSIEPLRSFLAESGITCLVNESVRMNIKGQAVLVVGVGDYWAEDTSPQRGFSKISKQAEDFCLVLNHNPDAKILFKNYPWDLMLCGHTHGGQLALPFLGTPFAPVRDHKYVAGLCTWEDRPIHISRGIGNLLGIRFNCPPEVSTLDLV